MAQYHLEGPPGGRADLAGVGEAPSQKELLAKRPFVGPAGRVLASALATAGIQREEILLTNVAPTIAEGVLVPSDEMRARLARELGSFRVRGVVAFGQTAAAATMGKPPRSLKKSRGVPAAPHEMLARAGIEWVMPTFHPASCLGHGGGGRKGAPQNRFFLAADLVAALRLLEEGVPKESEAEIRVAAHPLDFGNWLDELAPDEVIAVDIETRRGQIDTIGFGTSTSALVVPVLDPTGNWGPVWSKKDWGVLRAALRTWLEGPWPKVFQNGSYDVWWLAEAWGIIVGGWEHDTRILHHAIEPELPKDLGTLASLYAPGIGRAWKERH